ncbi:MAG: phosphodiester glycosidase family protein [Anaerolineales bacterium]
MGVQLYRKDYPSGTPDYVQVIYLKRGAEVRLLHGDISLTNFSPGVYGGSDARLSSRSIEQYWQEIVTSTSRAFCVTNGVFFNMYEYPTRLPFPLKVDGQIVSGGYSKGEFTDEKMMLEIWLNQVDIKPLTKLNFQFSTAPNILSGLSETSRKSPEKFVGRTFAGVRDDNGDGVFETLLLFSTQTARQIDAAQTLRDFGAQKVLMLDGGLSTQLLCQGKTYIKTDRLIPNAIAVLDGTQPYYPKPKPEPYPPKPGIQENWARQPNSNSSQQLIAEEIKINKYSPLTSNGIAKSTIHYQDAFMIPLFIFSFYLFFLHRHRK